MSAALAVWSQARRVGEIGIQQGRWGFVYDSDWIGWPDAFPLSPHFPFSEVPFIDTADDKRVEWFFENLLPEGGLREALARLRYCQPGRLSLRIAAMFPLQWTSCASD